MIVFPNAKINIGLNVLKKRKDGYHDISSLFYPVDNIFDILEIVPSNSFSFFSTGIQINSQENICVKAYNLLKPGGIFVSEVPHGNSLLVDYSRLLQLML